MKTRRLLIGSMLSALALLAGCTRSKPEDSQGISRPAAAPVYFKVDPASAGALSGTIHFTGKRPARAPIDMSEDPACVAAHHGKPFDESVIIDRNGTLANVFIYVKGGLEGKVFEVPAEPVTIDQRGCWFVPRVMGIQTGQVLRVVNSDPVTHNIHPMAVVNREWNHSQGEGDAPLARKFLKPEIMIRVKCNIHRWMHAFIGVVDSPYFAVSGSGGSYEIRNLPPGDYVIGAWHETLGTQERRITVPPSGKISLNFTFQGD
jgi:plastocyanin